MPRKGTTGLKGPSISEETPALAGDGGLMTELVGEFGAPKDADAPRPDGEAEDPAFQEGVEARFVAARRALLDVETPKEASAAARRMDEAAAKARGFAWEPDELGLPPLFPVRPLGKRQGRYFFLDPTDELRELTASKLSQQGELDALFSPSGGVLWAFYAQRSRTQELRIKYEDVRRDLITACGRLALREGVFDPAQRVRGRGAWCSEEGALVLHLGDKLWVGGEERELGQVEGYVYPREQTLPAPILSTGVPGDPDRGGRAAGQELLAMFKTWNFVRREADLDARLVLGLLVCVMMSGALDWRPQVFLVGDKGTGKSTLQKLIEAVLGARFLRLEDSSAPFIYQSLGQATIGIGLDEFENEGEDSADSAAGKVLKLARIASSGGRVGRGGQDGVPVGYEARGVFMFSAINMPSLKSSELSRMAVTQLQTLDVKSRPPKLSAAQAEDLGRRILGRVVSRWHEWPTVLEAWRDVLLSAGQDSRAADQFGTLLAAAHLVTADGKPLPEEIERVVSLLGVARLAETKHAKPNWERCAEWLLNAQPEAWRGKSIRSVGGYLSAFVEGSAPRAEDSSKTALEEARERLLQAGMTIVHAHDFKSDRAVYWLAVPASHAQVGALFRGSTWGARPGAESGTWMSALRSAVAIDMTREAPAKIDGRSTHCIQINLDRLLTKGEVRGEDEV